MLKIIFIVRRRPARRRGPGRPVADGPAARGVDRPTGHPGAARLGAPPGQAGRAAVEPEVPGPRRAGRGRSACADERSVRCGRPRPARCGPVDPGVARSGGLRAAADRRAGLRDRAVRQAGHRPAAHRPRLPGDPGSPGGGTGNRDLGWCGGRRSRPSSASADTPGSGRSGTGSPPAAAATSAWWRPPASSPNWCSTGCATAGAAAWTAARTDTQAPRAHHPGQRSREHPSSPWWARVVLVMTPACTRRGRPV